MSFKATILRFVSSLLLIISLAAAGCVTYGYIALKDFFSLSGLEGTVMIAALISILGLLFITSIFGLYGSWKQDQCGLKVFIFLGLFWTIVYIGAGVFVYLFLPDFTNGNCTANSIFTKFQDFYNKTLTSKYSVCQTNCGCYFYQQTNNNVYSLQQQIKLATAAPNASTTNNTLAIQTQACNGWTDGDDLPQGSLLYQFLENKIKCTGWCANTSSLFYRFSDVNRGIPQDYCYNRISSYFNSYGVIGYAVLFGLGGVILITALSAWAYLRQISEKKKQKYQDKEQGQLERKSKNRKKKRQAPPTSQRSSLYPN